MIRQTIAIFIDAYRDLNSRKLFWVTLILSAVFVGAFALLGVDDKGLQFAKAHFDMPRAQAEYYFKYIFRLVVVGIWLTWAATILALVSTAGVFPDLITGGSIDLYLSKPLSRARLFITKFFAGLTFVALQVIVVTAGGYLIMGIRGHVWIPQMFWAIPIVICFFSYLFGICVFFGVLTRSTVAALLLTIGAWGFLAVLDWGEPQLLMWHDVMAKEAEQLDLDVEDSLPAPTTGASTVKGPTAEERAHNAHDMVWRINLFQRIAYGIKTATPKTSDTTDLLSRYVFTDEEVERSMRPPPGRGRTNQRDGGPIATDNSATEGMRQSTREIRSRSVTWVVGTSLLFELVLVTWAGWIFCRRDY